MRDRGAVEKVGIDLINDDGKRMAKVSVSDNGPGIHEEFQAKSSTSSSRLPIQKPIR